MLFKINKNRIPIEFIILNIKNSIDKKVYCFNIYKFVI